MENFSELSVNESLKHSIARMHFKIPTPIQAQALHKSKRPKILKYEVELMRKMPLTNHPETWIASTCYSEKITL